MKVQEILKKDSQKFTDKPALIFQDKPVSFSELYSKVMRVACGLKNLGIKQQDAVGIYLPNCPDYVLSYLAIFSLGAVAVPLDFMLTADELVSCLSHSQAKALIASSREGVDFKEIQAKLPNLKIIYSLDKITNPELLDSLQSVKDDDPAIIFYTSGTTGKPKGVLWNYRHLDGAPAAMEYFVDLTDKDVKLCAIPLSHSGGLVYIQNCIMYGITLVLMERFNPVEFLKNIEKYKVTCFHMVPSMYYAILHVKEFEKYDLSSLRWVDVFGAPSAPELMRRFNQYCPNAKLLNGWGLTETAAPNTVTPLDSDRIESVGKPAPWINIKIFDDNDRELPLGEIGEVVMQSWVVMAGYFLDPQATGEVMRNGWFHTGDLGKFDKDAYLYIVGRKKEMIKVSGEIVYAPEVEEAILKHQSVKEAAVVGAPDKMRGECVLAFVVLKDAGAVKADDIRHYCKEHLAHFKVPHRVQIMTQLPKTRTGKIDKQSLKLVMEDE